VLSAQCGRSKCDSELSSLIPFLHTILTPEKQSKSHPSLLSCVQIQNAHDIPRPESAIFGNATGRLPSANITLTSFLWSRDYFSDVEDQLRHEFTFKPHIVAAAQRRLNAVTPPSWQRDDFIRVAIHVRRGDMLTGDRIRAGWLPPERDYFIKSMAYFNECNRPIQFIVISKDMNWCRKNIIGNNVFYLDGARSPVDDLAIASLCDHAIITIGTFGCWVGWFANGVTIAQNNTRKFDCEYKSGCIRL